MSGKRASARKTRKQAGKLASVLFLESKADRLWARDRYLAAVEDLRAATVRFRYFRRIVNKFGVDVS